MPSFLMIKLISFFGLAIVLAFYCLQSDSTPEQNLSKSFRVQNSNFDSVELNPDGNMISSTGRTAMMPPIMYGTAWKKERTQEFVELAVRTGFRGIDTACQPKHYFEPGVGEALKNLYTENIVRRSDIFLQTKFTSLRGQDPNNIPYDQHASLPDQVRQSFAQSLKNLNTDYIDSLVLHSPMEKMEDTVLVWKTLEEIYKEGKIKQLGISNTYQFSVFKELYDSVEIKPSVLQNRFYRDSGYDKELRAFCDTNGVKYQSFWTLTANPFILKSNTVATLAAKYDKTPAQIFFRFLQNIGITPLSGTKQLIHMKEDLNISNFSLTTEEITAIKNLLE